MLVGVGVTPDRVGADARHGSSLLPRVEHLARVVFANDAGMAYRLELRRFPEPQAQLPKLMCDPNVVAQGQTKHILHVSRHHFPASFAFQIPIHSFHLVHHD